MENKTFVWTEDLVREWTAWYSLKNERNTEFAMFKDMEEFKKSKEVKKDYLFTTEDGVEKFKNDRSNFVDTKTWELSSWSLMPNPLQIQTKGAVKTDFTHYKFFHDLEKAKEYILMNKPLFCIKDVFQFVQTPFHPDENNFDRDGLIELAKQKLNINY